MGWSYVAIAVVALVIGWLGRNLAGRFAFRWKARVRAEVKLTPTARPGEPEPPPPPPPPRICPPRIVS